MNAAFEGNTSLRFEVGDPAGLRLTLTITGVSISATGIDDVGELIGGFQLGVENPVSCERLSFTLIQTGDTVVYRDAETKLLIPHGAYDRMAALVTDMVQDRGILAAVEEVCLRLAR